MKKKRRINLTAILCAPLLFLGLLCIFSAGWYLRVFGRMSYIAMITTLTFNAGSTEKGMLLNYVTGGLLPAVGAWGLSMFLLFCPAKRRVVIKAKKGEKRISLFPLPRWLSATVSAVMSAVLIFVAAKEVDLLSYIKYMLSKPTMFFEENYTDPKQTEITFPENKRNLIVIYLESMETSFLSERYHGGNDVDPMPELCRLAKENINFSQNETVGGFTSPYGTDWTIAALIASASGAPLKLPDNVKDGNNFGAGGSMLPGLTTLNDILKDNGYYQAFMCGSDSTFGNRKLFYEEHGVDDIFDLMTARDEGFVPKDYEVWWGIEDERLFEYAKLKLTEMSKGDKPFAFSMLTADTHHIGGYYCRLCQNKFPERYENVMACSSRQVYAFVNWLKKQDFYEDTAIVILGDHPTMDNEYVTGNITKDYDRRVYNCFINSSVKVGRIKYREVSTFDMFPTILAAMGCEIAGDRLGLGCNLFSLEDTLLEEMGRKELNGKLAENQNTTIAFTSNKKRGGEFSPPRLISAI